MSEGQNVEITDAERAAISFLAQQAVAAAQQTDKVLSELKEIQADVSTASED